MRNLVLRRRRRRVARRVRGERTRPRPSRRVRGRAPGAAGDPARLRAGAAAAGRRPPAGRRRNAQAQTLEALFGGSAPRSAAERATLGEAGGVADPGIRSSVGDPKTNVVDKGSTTRDIVAAPDGDGQGATARAD